MHKPPRWALVVAGYCAATLILTYPVVFQLTTHIAGESSTSSDTLESLWGIWWWKHALLDLRQSPLDISVLNYPNGLSYALYPLASQAYVLALPMAIVSPVLAYNLVFLASFVFSGLTAYALCRELSGDGRAAFVGGLIWAFFPAKLASAIAGHLALVVIPLLPLMALSVRRCLAAPSIRRGAWSGLLVAAATTIHPIYVLYFTLPVLAALLWHSLASEGRAFWRREKGLALLVMLAVSAVLIGLLLAPALGELAQGRAVHVVPQGDVVGFSPDALGFFTPSVDHPLVASTPLAKAIVRIAPYQYEHLTYVGWFTLILAVVGAKIRWPQSRAWAGLAALTAIGALGPLLKFGGDFAQVTVAGEPYRVLLPYALIGNLPLVEWSRTPGRLTVTLMLALAVLATFGVNRLLQSPRLAPRAARAVGVISLAVLFEGLVRWPFPTTSAAMPPALLALRHADDGRAAIQAPGSGYADNQRMLYWQTLHQHPLVGGRVYYDLAEAARPAQLYRDLALGASLSTPEQRWSMLNAIDVGWVIYDASADPTGDALARLKSDLGAPVSADAEAAVFRIPDAPPSAPLQAVFDDKIELLGAWAPERVAPGQPVTVLLLWRARLSIGEDLTAFVHVINASGQLVAQHDGPPLNGEYPTSHWPAGERVGERVTISLPTALPSGVYQLRLGLYRLPEAARLDVTGAEQARDNAVVIGAFTLPP